MRACCFHKKPGGAYVYIMPANVAYVEEDGTGGSRVYFTAVIDSDTLASVNVQESLSAVVLQLEK